MPVYDIQCLRCKKEETIFRKLSEYNDLPECCGEVMSRKICAPNVISDIQPYRSMVTGEMITSRSQHRDHRKSHGCVEVGNEPVKPKTKSWIEQKTQKESLRKEIAARFDTI